MSAQDLAPVVVFAYNRPDHLRRTLDALAATRLASRTRVQVFADGPRAPAAADAVAAVRRVLAQETDAGRFAEFTVDASDHNRGLARSVIRGVGQVLDECDAVIVLEDDVLVTADFLEFMNACLRFYSNDQAVGSVTAFCPLRKLPPDIDGDVFLAQRNCSQSWGTWRRVWQGVDWSGAGAAELAASWRLRLAFNRYGNDRYQRLRRQLAGHGHSWSILFGLSMFLRNLGTVYPAVNRVRNIGYDGSGVNCGVGTAINEDISAAPYSLHRAVADPRIRREFKRVYSGPWPRSLLRDVLALAPRRLRW